MQRTIEHLQQLVAFYPLTTDQMAVRRLLEYCQHIVAQAGMMRVKLHENGGYYSLTAATTTTKRPRLLLQAHVDVVPYGTAPILTIDKANDTLGGRGVYDMLFATACYLTFIEQHVTQLPQLDFGIMLTGDEEIGGFEGAEYLLAQGYGAEVCFLPDAGEGFGDLSMAAKGFYNFDLKVRGQSHHGSRPWEGDSASRKLIYLLHELMAIFDVSDPHNSTMTITRLESGDCDNRGPDTALAHLDIRYKDKADLEYIQTIIKELCNKYDAGTERAVIADNVSLDFDHPAIREFLTVYEKHVGRPITQSKAHGGSDARFFAAKGIPVILIRPDGAGAHGDNETLSLSSLEKFYALLEDYILYTASRTKHNAT